MGRKLCRSGEGIGTWNNDDDFQSDAGSSAASLETAVLDHVDSDENLSTDSSRQWGTSNLGLCRTLDDNWELNLSSFASFSVRSEPIPFSAQTKKTWWEAGHDNVDLDFPPAYGRSEETLMFSLEL